MSKQLEVYYKRKKENLCVACGKNTPEEGILRCSTCREKRRLISANQKINRPEGNCRQCLTRKAEEGVTSCKHCRQQATEKSNRYAKECRIQVLTLYGGKCACCGLSNLKYLELDHKNNDGGKERSNLKGHRGGRYFALVLKQEKREDLQVLCANCHVAKKYGGCKSEDHVWVDPNPLPKNSSLTVVSRL